MMKLVWNLKNEVAIPLHHIRVFEIEDNTDMSETDKEKIGIKDYAVIARYQVCTGDWQYIFTSDSKSDCIHFIDELEDFL